MKVLRSRQATPLYFLLPTLLPLLILTVYPFLNATLLAFTKYDLYKKDGSFYGLGNFVELLTSDKLFWLALRNTVSFTIGVIMMSYVLGFITALALNRPMRFRTFFRAIVLIPWVCPPVVAGRVWQWIYDASFSPVTFVLKQIGLIDHNIAWLGDKNTALPAAMIMAVWKLLPFMVVMLLAGMQAVPDELYEAAAIDGAGPWQQLRYITVPLLNRIAIIALLFSAAWTFNQFDSVFTLTGGGPANLTMLLSLMAYQSAFRYYQVAYASTIGVVMLLLLSIPITFYARRTLRETE
jgi:multiple sugar transport system permease protein